MILSKNIFKENTFIINPSNINTVKPILSVF